MFTPTAKFTAPESFGIGRVNCLALPGRQILQLIARRYSIELL